MSKVIGAFVCLFLFVLSLPICFIRSPAAFTKALDALVNVCLFNGLQGETTSSHAGRWLVSGMTVPNWVKWVSAFTNLFEDNHCISHIQKQYEKERL